MSSGTGKANIPLTTDLMSEDIQDIVSGYRSDDEGMPSPPPISGQSVMYKAESAETPYVTVASTCFVRARLPSR